jgi:CheY-like chemotaxis protein
MTDSNVSNESHGAVLIVDGDILSRHAIADYLRHCGYKVVEAVSTDEAMTALGDPKLAVDIILCDIAAIGTQTGFELANWVRQNYPELEVRIAGSLASAADTAADLCESGPHLARPYEPQAVVDYIKRLRATRDRD